MKSAKALWLALMVCAVGDVMVQSQDLPDTAGLASQGVDVTMLQQASQELTGQHLGLTN